MQLYLPKYINYVKIPNGIYTIKNNLGVYLMSYTKELLERNQVKFEIEVDEQAWKDAIQKAYEKTKGKYRVEGFRQGKAPRHMIEKLYGVGVFFDDALDAILPVTYGEVMDKEKDLEIVSRPEISIIAISDTTLKYSAVVQLKPEVKLGQYTGLEFKKEKVKITKDAIKEVVNKAIEQAGAWEAVEGRPAQMGDKVVIDFVGKKDGVEFEGGKAEGQELLLGSKTFIPGFEEGVVGVSKGETKVIEVTFPVDYGAKDLAGQKATFDITVHNITEKKTPEYNDEFVKDISEFDTVAKYEESIKANLKKEAEEKAEIKLENEMIEKICSLCEVDVPDVLAKQQAEETLYDMEYRMQMQGLNPDDYYKYMQTTRDKMIESGMENARKTVKYQLVIEAIVKAEKFEATQADIDAHIEKRAKKANVSLEEYKKGFNDEVMGYVKTAVLNEKALEFLKEKNIVA